jgi:hypothetical protein
MKRNRMGVGVVGLAVLATILWVAACDMSDSGKDVGDRTPDILQPKDSIQTKDRAVSREDIETVDVPDPLPCGDGLCGDDENPCTCPEDCPLSPEESCCTDADCPQPTCGPCCVIWCIDYHCSDPIDLDYCCWNGECEEGETPEDCPEDCLSPICGNGLVEPGEECDDGNTTGGDGCGETCLLDGNVCGNGACDKDENPCNCEEDCPLSLDGACCTDTDCPQPKCGPCCVAQCIDYQCSEPIWLDDCCWNDECEEGETPENCPQDCQPTDCIPEGAAQCDYEDWTLECCFGLLPLSMIPVDEDGQCGIALPCGFVCTKCGDGDCGLGENHCNCEKDCPTEPGEQLRGQ